MKDYLSNLLPKKIHNRVAQNYGFFKIKPRVWLKKFSALRWLMALILILNLLGYYPNLSIPPIKKSQVFAKVNEQQEEVLPSSFSKPLNLPHPGYVSTRFSNFHPGIDITSGLGMPVHPITDGIVTDTGFDIFGLGNYLILSHQNGFSSKYAHLGKIFVKKGDKVSSDHILGEVGLTGKTSGPHTHLEISLHGENIDPQKLLPELPDMPKS